METTRRSRFERRCGDDDSTANRSELVVWKRKMAPVVQLELDRSRTGDYTALDRFTVGKIFVAIFGQKIGFIDFFWIVLKIECDRIVLSI